MHTLKQVHLGLPDISGWFKKIRKEMKRKSDIRSTINQLSSLSDYELADMGIARCDIRRVAEGGSR